VVPFPGEEVADLLPPILQRLQKEELFLPLFDQIERHIPV
jgi:hypothetical protein